MIDFTVVASAIGVAGVLGGVILKLNSGKTRKHCARRFEDIERDVEDQKKSTNEFKIIFKGIDGKFDLIQKDISFLAESLKEALKHLKKRSDDQ